MTLALQDKVSIVTGAARGIGRAIVLAFLQSGAKIVGFDVNEANLKKLEEETKGGPGTVETQVVDVTDSAKFTAAINEVAEKYGRIDVLVNNAGITRDGLLISMEDDQFDLVLSVNLRAAFVAIRAAARHMIRARSGRIVNIASVSGLMGNPGQANYAASKAGLIGLTKTAAKELGKRGVTVNAVAPGFIATEMTNALPDKAKEKFLENIALRRPGLPEDVAQAVAYLAEPRSAYITGQVLVVDGGLYM